VTHDVSFTASRFEHMPPSAVALAVLLHLGVGLALFWISPLRPVDHIENAIEITMDAPEAVPAVAEQKAEPTPGPAATPAPPPPPPPAPVASAPTPTPQPVAPPMRLGLPPPPAERSTNPRDVAGVEKPEPKATDMPTPDTVKEAGPKEEPKPEEPKPQEARQEPPPQQQAPQQQALAQPEPPPPPAQQALARPEPPPPPPPPSLEQALPPLDAPPPPVTERDIPKPLPVPRPPAPPPPQQQAARPTAPPPPAPPPPAQRPAPSPPAHAPPQPQQVRPSPLAPHTPGGSQSQAAAKSSPTFRNPADDYGQRRAQEQYLWQVMRRIAQFPYVPKNTSMVREEGTVLTRVTISRQGQLLDVVMENSSGLPSLDAGVLETIRRASPYPPLPADIPGNQHTFQLPVSFRYNEQR